ncbi:MAG: phytanoyl-CoA dioxygenase family protein [Acidimicrobiia bacterium]|jgi:ectoine hydroxylase-related dioxygenase (phytanoyl-CoA dioxygenase family)
MSAAREPVAPSAQSRFELDTYGYTVFERVIDEDAAGALAASLAEADAAIGTDYVHQEAYARHVMNLLSWDERFVELIDDPVVLGAVEAILGPAVILGSVNARIVRPGDPDQPFHSDIPPQLRKPGAPVMVQAVWMLDGFNPDNGATRIVPGSHRAPEAEPPAGVEVPHWVAPTGPVGSVLLFNGQCWHGGGANRSDAIRRALFAHYRVSPWMRFQCDPHDGFTDDVWQRLNPRQRALLRMEQGIGQPNSADYSR